MTNSSPAHWAEANSGHKHSSSGEVCVVIAAWNAGATIARAVSSALEQAETAEVVVVDDASSDNTAQAARSADDGSGRLQVIRLDVNQGPSAARNRAIAASQAPYIAILDADDYLLPNRFKAMLSQPDWDVIADNIVFVRESAASRFNESAVRDFAPEPVLISLEAFIAGNMSRPGHYRGELGFAKPLIRRAFFAEHAITYDESLRLGEDYALYALALANGARFLRILSCGYVAIEREGSLSGRHRTADLAALLAFDRRFIQMPGLSASAVTNIACHAAQLRHKLHYREMIDIRRLHGRARAALEAMRHPAGLLQLAKAFLSDKLDLHPPVPHADGERYLFT